MKFKVLKTLPVRGRITADWKENIHQSYGKDPVAVKRDYNDLVKAIADLELIEEYLRKQVLQEDESTNTLRKTVDLARELGYFIAPILHAVSPGAGAKVDSTLAMLDILRNNEANRALLRSF